ncbi:hypothetical protein HAX54_032593 [Datura stramonium]|uniref:Uncharacterized protein n=1 Tax=Datura stramonium TaxID=4076 RepID=A0ABS8VDY2_DATST|nr:hypothetical protein [Datura stramonium]
MDNQPTLFTAQYSPIRDGPIVPPLQVHERPPGDCTLNSFPVMSIDTDDEYRVIHSENVFDEDTQSVAAQEEDEGED